MTYEERHLVSHVYILRDLKHPRFKIGKANDILARARSFQWESVDFQLSLGLRLGSETDAYSLEKILHRTFRFASVNPLEVVASGGSIDGASEWFDISCWTRLLQYLRDNQDLHPHEAVSGDELAALLEKKRQPSQAAIVREQLNLEKEARRLTRELDHLAYRRSQLESLRASLEIVRPRIAQELERLRINGSIVGICEMSVGSYLVLADKLRLPSGALLWGLKPHSTQYDYPNGCGSIMSSFSQVASSAGTVSKVELPTAYIFDDADSEEDAIIRQVFRDEFGWLKQLKRVPESWVREIFPPGISFAPLAGDQEREAAIGRVIDFLSCSSVR